jgi:hypothetical protein
MRGESLSAAECGTGRKTRDELVKRAERVGMVASARGNDEEEGGAHARSTPPGCISRSPVPRRCGKQPWYREPTAALGLLDLACAP